MELKAKGRKRRFNLLYAISHISGQSIFFGLIIASITALFDFSQSESAIVITSHFLGAFLITTIVFTGITVFIAYLIYRYLPRHVQTESQAWATFFGYILIELSIAIVLISVLLY